ncbi:unnamed protein product, partial [Ectocarpus sp. 12 AP-2014]
RAHTPLVRRVETVRQALQDLVWSLLRLPLRSCVTCWKEKSTCAPWSSADPLLPRSFSRVLSRNTFIDCSALRTRAGVPQTTKSKTRQDGSSRNSEKRFVESVTSHFWTA